MTTGNSSTDEIVKLLLGSRLSTTAPGVILTGMPGSQMYGSYVGSIDQQQKAYGFRDEQNTNVIVPTALNTQATSYLKSVMLRGYQGTSVVFEALTYQRVFREIWAPSRNDAYRKYSSEKLGMDLRTIELPQINPIAFNFEQYGSILKQQDLKPNAFGSAGAYQLLWIRWYTTLGGKISYYGALFDHFYCSLATEYSIDLTPSGSGGYSKSNNKEFSQVGLNTYSSNGITGARIGAITSGPYADPNIIYYLQDDPAKKIPILQSKVSNAQSVIPIVGKEAIATLSGPNTLKFVDLIPLSENPPITLPINSMTTINSKLKLRYIGLCGKINGFWLPLYFNQDDADTIQGHKDNAESNKTGAQFATTGGKTINRTGASQNYIVPNYKFGSQPQSFAYWTPQKTTSDPSFLPSKVVDGSTLGGLGAGIDGEGGWITGYAPNVPANPTLAQTLAALVAARANYYYILPTQQRLTSGQKTVVFSGNNRSDSDFTDPGSPDKGLHWGKFLKSDVNASRGFSSTQLVEYQKNLALEASNAVNNRLAESFFTASILQRVNNYEYSVTGAVTLSLRNVEGIALSTALRGFGSSSTAPLVPGEGPGTPGPVDPNAPSVPSGPPKDWTKAITDAAAKLISATTVESLTQQRLQTFLQRQANLGAPLSTLKTVFFDSLLEAKIVALQQTKSISRKAAELEVRQDPIYKALQAFAKNLKPAPKTGSGGTESGASDGSSNTNPEVAIRINVTRGLPGYKQGIREASVPGVPELVQTYEIFPSGATVGETKIRRFEFPFVPREVNYSGIGTKWTEIDRTGNYPVVDWSGFQLLKISFNFDIVDRRFDKNTGFGLYYSCEDQITKLREMAQTPYPVTFLNMDKFMSDDVRWPTLVKSRGMEFVIAEFTVTAVQRTPSVGSGGVNAIPNQISRATCSMTLQEIPIENVDIIQMPPIKPCKKKCEDIPDIPQEKFNQYLLVSTGVSVSR